MQSTVAACPICGGLVEIDYVDVGVEIECPDCERLLAVTNSEPIEVAPALPADLIAFYDDERRA